jgi:hypothetical protein
MCVYGQYSHPENPRALDRKIYHYFFVEQVNMDIAAQKAEAHGQNGDKYRTQDSRVAGLTDEEGAKVRQIAEDCVRILIDQDAKMKALMDERREQLPTTKSPLSKDEIAQFNSERDEAIDQHIFQLKETLGEYSFEKLDLFVKERFSSKV